MSPASCLILSGPIGSGKTTALRSLVADRAERGERVAAALQPDRGRGPDGVALGFQMELLSSASGRLVSERMDLAVSRAQGLVQGRGAESPLGDGRFVFGRFDFRVASFARAEAFLREELGPSDAEGPAVDVVGLDEIGRLELDLVAGLRPCLDLALRAIEGGGGPSLLVCASRDSNSGALSDIVAALGIEVRVRQIRGDSPMGS